MTPWTDRRVPNASGVCAPQFQAAGDAFAQNFEDGAELGGSFAAWIDGNVVVDIRGGFADRAQKIPWTDETLSCVYSSGKALISLLIARAVSRGLLDYDACVSDYWPEFAQNGKEGITLATLLSHQAGLVGFADEMAPEGWLDWAGVIHRIEAMAPLWPPGTACGYHPQTYGFAAGEILRRVDGRSIGTIIREDIAEPAGLNIFCGLKPQEMTRVAQMPKPPRAPDLGDINEATSLAFLRPHSMTTRIAPNQLMAAEIPGSNMHGDARGLAGAVHPFVSGVFPQTGDVLSPGAVDAALTERIRAHDLVLPFELSWAAGLMRNINRHFGPNANAYGHAGFGGSCVVIDRENRLTLAYVMNKMSPHLVGDPRATRIFDAFYKAL